MKDVIENINGQDLDGKNITENAQSRSSGGTRSGGSDDGYGRREGGGGGYGRRGSFKLVLVSIKLNPLWI
ncbi:hypothetical protein FRX31_035173 [Thalictrum thalictroides]|uniref:Uncharacterized protein n=1 Tax=Thalictrum thalictroides TaxID=46969 RepID=A0A7J6USI4_THATH|nr:hypothetical protein FRX31_035173 [Thalictrum thalictroides]